MIAAVIAREEGQPIVDVLALMHIKACVALACHNLT